MSDPTEDERLKCLRLLARKIWIDSIKAFFRRQRKSAGGSAGAGGIAGGRPSGLRNDNES